MAQTIIIKNNNITTTEPTTTDLVVGELAINTSDKQIFTKHSDNTIKKFIPKSFTELNDLKALFDNNKEYTGFLDNSLIDVSYNHTNRTITLTGTLFYYYRGVLKQLGNGASWVSPACTSPSGTKSFLYSIDGETFSWTTTPWETTDVMIAVENYNTDINLSYALKEIHGCSMSAAEHEEFHTQIGTYKVSGGNITLGTFTENTPTDAANSPGFDSAIIKDEDLKTIIPLHNDGDLYTTMYVNAGVSVFDTTKTLPFYASANTYIQVNDITNGTMTDGINGRWYNVYEILIPVTSDISSQKYKRIFVQPQTTFSSLASAQAEDVRTISLGSLTNSAPELVYNTRMTFRTRSGDSNTGKCRIETNGITYITGSRVSQISVSGFTANNHTSLSNLNWTTSGHIGTPNTLPIFSSIGEANETEFKTINNTSLIGAGNVDVGGIPNSGFSFKYKYSSTLGASPISGHIQFDNLDLTLATLFSIAETDLQGINIDLIIDELTAHSEIKLTNSDGSVYHIFHIINSFISQDTTDNIPITYTTGLGTFIDNEDVTFSFTPNPHTNYYKEYVLQPNTTGWGGINISTTVDNDITFATKADLDLKVFKSYNAGQLFRVNSDETTDGSPSYYHRTPDNIGFIRYSVMDGNWNVGHLSPYIAGSNDESHILVSTSFNGDHKIYFPNDGTLGYTDRVRTVTIVPNGNRDYYVLPPSASFSDTSFYYGLKGQAISELTGNSILITRGQPFSVTKTGEVLDPNFLVDGSVDAQTGWGNNPALCSAGGFKRFTLSEDQYNALNNNVGNVKTLSTPGVTTVDALDTRGQYSIMNQTVFLNNNFGNYGTSHIELDSNFSNGARVRFVDLDDDYQLILIPSGQYLRGVKSVDNYFTQGLSYNSITDRYYILTKDATDGDTVELQRSGNIWSANFFDFLSYTNGALPWSTVDKTGATAADVNALPVTATINTQPDVTYTIDIADAGKIITFNNAAATTVTLPDPSAFPDGFQCQLWNMSANAVDVSLSGTVIASGTIIAQKKTAMLLKTNGVWYCAGGLS